MFFDLRGISLRGPCAAGQSDNCNTHGTRPEYPYCSPELRTPSERVCGSSSRAGTGTDQAPVRAGADCGRAHHGCSFRVAQAEAG